MKNRTLFGHLLAWALGALLIVWLAFVILGLRTGIHEADELTDGHLASTASLLINQRSNEFVGTRDVSAPNPELKRHDYQQSMSIIIWDQGGKVLSRTGNAPRPLFDTTEGFATLKLGPTGELWRTFARWDSPTRQRRLMVLLSEEERDDLAWDIAKQVAEPGLWLLPVVAFALSIAIKKGLNPLSCLSKEVLTLNIQAGEPLQKAQRHQEFQILVDSINLLIVRYQAAMTRERELAGELAHELRTPLTSLSLHAQSLQGALSVLERKQAHERIAAEALRAGQVLQHLLTLARTSHAELAEAAVPLDLARLTAGVLSEYSQICLDNGHELALIGSGTYPMTGHKVLLEIALRNLVENALGHAPAGSVIYIELDAHNQYLQISNEQLKNTQHLDSKDTVFPRLGLGLGHRVIEKIATLHKGSFSETSDSDNIRRYRISFAYSNKLINDQKIFI